jgi:opacity protein-like surface antigen
MKRWFTLSMLTLLAVMFTSTTGFAQFKAGNHYIGVNATVVTEPVGWGVNYEFGYEENLGLGLIVRYWSPEDTPYYESTGTGNLKRETFMTMFQAAYHPLTNAVYDPYGGVRVGYAYYNETWTTEGIVVGITGTPTPKAESNISMSIIGGIRYFVANNISIEGALEYFLFNDEKYFRNESDTALMFALNFTLH